MCHFDKLEPVAGRVLGAFQCYQRGSIIGNRNLCGHFVKTLLEGLFIGMPDIFAQKVRYDLPRTSISVLKIDKCPKYRQQASYRSTQSRRAGSAAGCHHESRCARKCNSSRNASSSGVLRPRHNAPMTTGGKPSSGRTRTFGENVFFGMAADTPMPRPLAT